MGFFADDEDSMERRRRPQMSMGGIASLCGIIALIIGGVRYLDNIELRLDSVASQSDIIQLRARMDGLEGWFRSIEKARTAP